MIQLNIQSPSYQNSLLKGLRSGFLALLVYSAFGAASRILEDALNLLGRNPDSTSGSGIGSESSEFQHLAIAACVTLLWTLFSSSAQLTYLAKRFFPKSPAVKTQNLWSVVNLLAIESTRALAACIFRIPLLIVPAVIEWFRLMPVPFIVLLDADYQLGKSDALMASRRFFSNNKLLVIALTLPLSLGIAIELFISNSPIDAVSIWEAPLQHVGSIILVAAVRLAIDSGIFWVYRQKLGLNSNSIG